MAGTPIGLAVETFFSSGGRWALEVALRLETVGLTPRLAVHDRAGLNPSTVTGAVLDVETVSRWPFPATTRASSFDRSVRDYFKKRETQLTHGFGDLTAQHVMSLCCLERARQKHDATYPEPDAGIGYLRRFQLAAGGARLYVAPSEMARQNAIDLYGLSPVVVRTLLPGADTRRYTTENRGGHRFTLLRAAAWGEHYKVILVAADAGPSCLDVTPVAQAVERLSARFPHALCVVGPVDLSNNAAVQTLVKKGLFFQVTSTLHLEKYFAAADVCVLPSRYDEFGQWILDALACGTPVVVGAQTGVKECLTPGEDACVVDAGTDPGAWADAIEKAEALDRARCRLTALAHPWETHVTALAKIYQELL